MKTVGKSATNPESRLSQQIATHDDVAANEEEVEEQIEEDNVENAARENGTGSTGKILRSSKEVETADDALASMEELKSKPTSVAPAFCDSFPHHCICTAGHYFDYVVPPFTLFAQIVSNTEQIAASARTTLHPTKQPLTF